MELQKGRDYTGEGSGTDPIVFAEHVSYYAAFRELCEQLGLDPEQRQSMEAPDGEIHDIVADGDGHRFFRAPRRSSFDAPLAWQLVGRDGAVQADVTWRGGADVDIDAGPATTALLRKTFGEAFGSRDGVTIDTAMGALGHVSGGALRSRKVPRARVLAVLAGERTSTAGTDTSGGGRSATGDASSAELDAGVRKTGRALLILAALPAFVSVLTWAVDDARELRTLTIYGLLLAVALGALGVLILLRRWWALYLGAGICVALAGIVAVLGFGSTWRMQGIILAGGILTAVPFLVRAGNHLRARSRR